MNTHIISGLQKGHTRHFEREANDSRNILLF